MLEVKLEDRVNSEEGVGIEIRKLVKKRRIRSAAELALAEFGIERAVKIFLNNGRGGEAGPFAEENGYKLVAFRLYNDLGMYKQVRRLAKELGVGYKIRNYKKPPPHTTLTL